MKQHLIFKECVLQVKGMEVQIYDKILAYVRPFTYFSIFPHLVSSTHPIEVLPEKTHHKVSVAQKIATLYSVFGWSGHHMGDWAGDLSLPN